MELLAGRLHVDNLDSFVADLGGIGDTHDVTIQAFDARYVAGRRHLERAVALADRAIERGENIARDRAVEILCYAAGRRQIDRALEMGVDEGESDVVVLVDGAGNELATRTDLEDRFGLESVSTLETADGDVDADAEIDVGVDAGVDPDVDADPDTLRSFFEISDAERSATTASLQDLVCERVALLEVEK
ncbi:KEOPS complex subunit Cgi121 [Natronosalvus halobius]|uniref:KEOPS complex subunit Cgi121 n=1 Tax=Natronosalvus halobius TaxID=2953746 RepID=UPI00209D3E82|nr:KEOPS complex subunit Cgi121 [Natronosalvus halobius]USZ70642.1 KEOPS complex subunit Cgi121 [Natronosalvus halobius]